ncbi:Broad specificity phosphatase PhoE [Gracilibacillus orientalis]|uniref:Broad specificity phosphatase PhoE n=1 Tax=Gracilibacillus orientalis TaxID=334253 RepID=A0A1I4Q2Y7_9BACI|nr:phosphoglycerate mutase family protein [Gracilibacillus orientalis]SFM34441.1 Broad specificity phosphatase PhoE [Gracilibacillus orientalis]
MEISFIRHGKSEFITNRQLTAAEFNDWMKRYDNSGVLRADLYPSETLKKVQTANLMVTSDLKRSIQSAKLLHANFDFIYNRIFHETELPRSSLKGIKLSPSIWAFLLRCLWLFGYSKGCESITHAKKRARTAAQLLIEYAETYDSVGLVGHGFFNMLIAKELLNMGWKGKRKTNSKHWNCTTYIALE